MLGAILSILGSSAFGSILGGVFAFLNRKADIEAKRLDLAHEVQSWAHQLSVREKDIEHAKIEAQGRKEVAIVEGESMMEAARFGAIAQAQAADNVTAEELKAAGKMRWLLVLASAFNRFIRPMATVILATAAISVNLLLMHKLAESWPTLTQAQQYDAAMQAFAWITGQASAALGYWFVARGSSK
jgi:hypothetical protein